MMQKRSIVRVIALLVCTLLAATAGLQSKGPPPSNWPVNVNLRNDFADGVKSDVSSEWCQESGPMVLEIHYCSGEQNVRAEMLGNSQGNFVFDTNDRSGTDGSRRLVLNFGDQVDQVTFPTGELTIFNVDAFIGTIGVTGTSADGNLRNMAVENDPSGLPHKLSRKTRITWVQGTFQFSLRWDGLTVLGKTHSYVEFTCNASLGNGFGCSEWTVSPLVTTASPLATAGLYSVSTKGGTTEWYHGTYSMPFSMTLVRQ